MTSPDELPSEEYEKGWMAGWAAAMDNAHHQLHRWLTVEGAQRMLDEGPAR